MQSKTAGRSRGIHCYNLFSVFFSFKHIHRTSKASRELVYMHYNGLTERRGKEDEGPGKTKDRKYSAGKWQTKYPGRRVKD